jgi:hypothetical protein
MVDCYDNELQIATGAIPWWGDPKGHPFHSSIPHNPILRE